MSSLPILNVNFVLHSFETKKVTTNLSTEYINGEFKIKHHSTYVTIYTSLSDKTEIKYFYTYVYIDEFGLQIADVNGKKKFDYDFTKFSLQEDISQDYELRKFIYNCIYDEKQAKKYLEKKYNYCFEQPIEYKQITKIQNKVKKLGDYLFMPLTHKATKVHTKNLTQTAIERYLLDKGKQYFKEINYPYKNNITKYFEVTAKLNKEFDKDNDKFIQDVLLTYYEKKGKIKKHLSYPDVLTGLYILHKNFQKYKNAKVIVRLKQLIVLEYGLNHGMF